MSLFISSNSTNALIAKTDSLEKKFNELEKQKKSKNSFIKKIKSFTNSSAKAGIRKKPKTKSLKTLKKELNKANVLMGKLKSHSSKLEKKDIRKTSKNGGQGTLNQLLGGTRKASASEKRLMQKIDSDLSKATQSLELNKKTRDTITKLDDKIGLMETRIKKHKTIKELKDFLSNIPYNTTIRGFGETAQNYVKSFGPKKDNNTSDQSGNLIEL